MCGLQYVGNGNGTAAFLLPPQAVLATVVVTVAENGMSFLTLWTRAESMSVGQGGCSIASQASFHGDPRHLRVDDAGLAAHDERLPQLHIFRHNVNEGLGPLRLDEVSGVIHKGDGTVGNSRTIDARGLGRHYLI